ERESARRRIASLPAARRRAPRAGGAWEGPRSPRPSHRRLGPGEARVEDPFHVGGLEEAEAVRVGSGLAHLGVEEIGGKEKAGESAIEDLRRELLAQLSCEALRDHVAGILAGERADRFGVR